MKPLCSIYVNLHLHLWTATCLYWTVKYLGHCTPVYIHQNDELFILSIILVLVFLPRVFAISLFFIFIYAQNILLDLFCILRASYFKQGLYNPGLFYLLPTFSCRLTKVPFNLCCFSYVMYIHLICGVHTFFFLCHKH